MALLLNSSRLYRLFTWASTHAISHSPPWLPTPGGSHNANYFQGSVTRQFSEIGLLTDDSCGVSGLPPPFLAPASPPHTMVGKVSARVQGFGEWPFPPGELEWLIFTPVTSPSIGRKSHGFAHTQDSNPDPLTCRVTKANGPKGCGLLEPLVPPPGKRRRWECSCLQGCHDTAVYFLMWHFDLSLIINY